MLCADVHTIGDWEKDKHRPSAKYAQRICLFLKSQSKKSAKPLFIGSIPIAASNLSNDLEPPNSAVFSGCPRNVHELLKG